VTPPGGIAVVIPFHRADRWFPEALASVLAQTRPPDEIVVVDDASPPGEARTLEAPPAGVRVVRLPRNGGVSRARQAGTEATTAELVAYLDADDRWEPRYLEEAEKLLAAHPDAPAAYGAIAKWYPDGRLVPYTDKPALLDLREAIVQSHLVPSGLVVRRPALKAVGGWRPERAIVEDWDLTVRLLERFGAFPLIPEPLVHYRVGNEASMNARHLRMLRAWARTLRQNRALVDREYGPGAARRRGAKALADRRDRAGGVLGACFGFAARLRGPPLGPGGAR